MIDVVDFNIAKHIHHGGDIDHPGLAGCCQALLQQDGQQEVGQVVGLGYDLQAIIGQVFFTR